MPLLPSRDEFAAVLGTRFAVMDAAPDAGELDLDLVDVSELRVAPGQQMFSICFRGPLERFLPQRICHLQHDRLGDLDLFLVPIAKKEDGFLYEAVFNHLIAG